MLELSKWVHPRTGDIRIYVNGLCSNSTKVWFQYQPPDTFNCNFRICTSSEFCNRSECGNIANQAEEYLTKLAGYRINRFENIINLATK